MGIWLPTKKTNANLVQELRDTWRLVQVKRGRDEVRIEHVRSHTSVPGNELADKLADAGRQLTSHARDMGVDDARPLMRSIALAANTRQRRTGHRPHPNSPPNPSPNQPFIIYQDSQPYQNTQNMPIRDDG